METVKIDAQKLQLLNDRISQTIDALNQVRLSAHGLQQSFAPQVSPQLAPQVSPQLAPQVSPQLAPQVSPQLAPQVSPQLAAQWAVSQLGLSPLGLPQLGLNALYGAGLAAQGLPLQGLPLQGLPTGLEHSAPATNLPLGTLGFSSALGHVPLNPPLAQSNYLPSLSLGQLSYGNPGLGLSHTGPVLDPYWQLRLQSSFPYAQRAVPAMMAY